MPSREKEGESKSSPAIQNTAHNIYVFDNENYSGEQGTRVVMKIIVIDDDKMEIGKGDRRVVGSRVCMQIK